MADPDSHRPAPPLEATESPLAAIGYLDWSEDRGGSREGVSGSEDGACPGYNLYNSRPRTEARLLDLEGREAHRWQRLDQEGGWHHIELLSDLRLLVVVKDVSISCLDRDSRVLWEAHARFHHDVAPLPGGEVAALARRNHRATVSGRDLTFLEDVIVVLDEGKVVEEIGLHDHLSASVPAERWNRIATASAPVALAKGGDGLYDVYHTNSIQAVTWQGVEAFLLSVRETDELVVVARRDPRVLWRWGPGILDGQHHATLLDVGGVLVFDNAVERKQSRVLLVDPETGSFKDLAPAAHFFTPTRGAAQLLPNGDLLVTESDAGHAFEIGPSGQTVWEFWNPDRRRGQRAAIYRMMRIHGQEALAIERLLEGAGSR